MATSVSPFLYPCGPKDDLLCSDQVPSPSLPSLPSPESFLPLLQDCRDSKDLVLARKLHLLICDNGFESHQSVGNYLVPLFVDCSSLQDAHHAFSKLAHPNEHSWTSLIQGHVERGHLLDALNIFAPMQAHKVIPSSHTYVALLKACSQLKNMTKGLQVYHEILLHGCDTHPFVCNILVDMFASCGALADATYVFDRLDERDIVSWTALISGYADKKLGDEAFQSLDLMLAEGVSPNTYTFACSLKACDSPEDIEKAQGLHKEITKHGFEDSTIIGNALVDTYAKSGLFLEAQATFKNLQEKDVVSWTSLTLAYMQYGLAEEALDHFEWMQVEGVRPNAVTYVCGLKACGSLYALEKIREVHAEIIKEELEEDIPIANELVGMYGTFGLLEEAQKVFDMMPARDPDTWNTLIGKYADQGFGDKALFYLEVMQTNGVTPDDTTFVSALRACASMRDIEVGLRLHSKIVKVGYETQDFIGTALVDMYSKCHALIEAQHVCENLSTHDPVIWTAMITGYVDHEMGKEALKCFHRLQMARCSPDAVMLVCLLKACSITGSDDTVKDLYSWMTKVGMQDHALVKSSLVDAYCKCGLLVDAHEVFDQQSLSRDPALWNTLIAGYTKQGFGESAIDVLEDMEHNSVWMDMVTIVCGFKACAMARATSRGRALHQEAVKRGLERVSIVGNGLVYMYVKCDLLAEAKLLVKDVRSWTSLMTGYWNHGLGEEAVNCFVDMELQGISPDVVTFVCSLRSCANIGSLSEGQQVHVKIVMEGFEDDPLVCSNLAEMYGLCGSHLEAQDVYELLPSKEEPWETSIAG